MSITEMAFSVIGGLGIFLLGMRYMSDGLQSVAGPTLRRLIGSVTNNRIMAVGMGVIVTCIVQSSSITTVMVVGLVNSNLMTLVQSIGVVMGANIGTTITGWILVLKIGKWGLPIIGGSAFFFLFSKNEKVRFIAQAFLGVGLIFFGLALMKNGFKPIRSYPEFTEWFQVFQATTYLGVLKCAAVGCILTLIVQSSSATLGITIGLASTGVIPFETAAALVLGENIGTTITAFLASLGAGVNARRAAYFHIIFNLLGCFIITLIFFWYLPIIEMIMGKDPRTVVTVDGEETLPYITQGIATVHTVFNVANTLVFLPFIGFFAYYLEKYVREGSKKKTLTHLDFHIYDSPFAAMEQTRVEINKMERSVRDMLDDLDRAVSSPERDRRLETPIFEREETLDVVQEEITEFLSVALKESLSRTDIEEARNQLRLADEFESISDYIAQVLKLYLRLNEGDVKLDATLRQELTDLHRSIAKFVDDIIKLGETFGVEQKIHLENEGDEITRKVRGLRSSHWERLAQHDLSPLVSTTYSDITHAYRKIKDHMINVLEVKAGEK